MKISDHYYKPVETREHKLLRLLRDGYCLCKYKDSQAGAMSLVDGRANGEGCRLAE